MLNDFSPNAWIRDPTRHCRWCQGLAIWHYCLKLCFSNLPSLVNITMASYESHGVSQITGGFSLQRASTVLIVPMSWRHHTLLCPHLLLWGMPKRWKYPSIYLNLYSSLISRNVRSNSYSPVSELNSRTNQMSGGMPLTEYLVCPIAVLSHVLYVIDAAWMTYVITRH